MASLDGDPAALDQGAGGRYLQDAVLLALQAPTSGAPRSTRLDTTTDPLLPARPSAEQLAHLFPDLYDTRPESHLSRLLKAVLGDSGAGQLRRRYLVAHMGSVVSTTRYLDLDRLYGALLGFPRLSGERLDLSPYTEAATSEQWAELDARDAAYRSRVSEFSRAIPMAGTPAGMAAVARALLSVDCRVYETWALVDENGGGNPGGAPPAVAGRTYGEVETHFVTYGAMDGGTYADVEGGTGSFGRTTTSNRAEFVVRPLRSMTLEEAYRLTRVLDRLKPAGALLTVDAQGVAVHSPAHIRDASASSTYWEVRTRVVPRPSLAAYYPQASATPVDRARPAFTAYQGEAWSYNSDIQSVTAYTQSTQGAVISAVDYERVTAADGRPVDLTPDRAIADPEAIMRGRAVSDAVMVSAPYAGARPGADR
jgi:hypothetical protein